MNTGKMEKYINSESQAILEDLKKIRVELIRKGITGRDMLLWMVKNGFAAEFCQLIYWSNFETMQSLDNFGGEC